MISDNKIMFDATPPGGGSRGLANYKSHRTLDLAVKLQQLPALQSVNITPASGYLFPPPQKRELCCGRIENKVKSLQNLLAVMLQLQSNMLLASVTALKGAIDQNPTTASTITHIMCYGVLIGPYPLVLLSGE